MCFPVWFPVHHRIPLSFDFLAAAQGILREVAGGNSLYGDPITYFNYIRKYS